MVLRSTAMEILFVLLIIGVCYFFFKLASTINEACESEYGEGCINWWSAVITPVLLLITFFFFDSTNIATYLWFLATGASLCLGLFMAYQKIKSFGGNTKQCLMAVLAQLSAILGIVVVIFMLLALIISNDKRKRKK